jgi:hypothetical protein
MEAEAGTQREVTLVTPVLTHPWHYEESALHKRLVYTKGAPLHQLRVPSNVANLGRCMAIDLPLDGIDDFVAQQLHWLPLLPDS